MFTFPQLRQWCLRRMRVNFSLQWEHLLDCTSGIQTGGSVRVEIMDISEQIRQCSTCMTSNTNSSSRQINMQVTVGR